MQAPKKYTNKEIINIVAEPQTDYEITSSEKVNAQNTPEHEILLRKLLELGLKQSEMGIGISNEEMKRRTKEKFPFLK